MCLAIPMKVIALDGMLATTEVDGVTRQARVDLLEDVALGDYVLVHAGLAIARVNAADAEETLRVLRKLANEIQ